eukprot:403366946
MNTSFQSQQQQQQITDAANSTKKRKFDQISQVEENQSSTQNVLNSDMKLPAFTSMPTMTLQKQDSIKMFADSMNQSKRKRFNEEEGSANIFDYEFVKNQSDNNSSAGQKSNIGSKLILKKITDSRECSKIKQGGLRVISNDNSRNIAANQDVSMSSKGSEAFDSKNSKLQNGSLKINFIKQGSDLFKENLLKQSPNSSFRVSAPAQFPGKSLSKENQHMSVSENEIETNMLALQISSPTQVDKRLSRITERSQDGGMLSASNCKAKRSSLRRSQSLSHHNMATQRGSHPCILSDFHDDDVFSDIAQLGSPNQEEEEKDFPDCSQSNINPIGEGDNISMKSFDGSFYQDILGYDPSNRAMNDSFQGMQSYSSNYNNNNMLNDAMMMSQSQMANYSHQPTKELSPMNENEEVNILDTAVFQTQTQAGFLWSKNKRFVVEPKEQVLAPFNKQKGRSRSLDNLLQDI